MTRHGQDEWDDACKGGEWQHKRWVMRRPRNACNVGAMGAHMAV